MEARFFRAALLAAVVMVSAGASYRTPNFIIQTTSPQFAEQLGKAAEQYRHDLAIAWTGSTMPDWAQPCVCTIQAGPNLGAGGATTFMFDRGEVFGWRMTIQGSEQRLLDSVLPHEITHMIFASHFRKPLPRWADEGGATTMEHVSEKNKHRQMLLEFLRTNRGIAFNQMFAMTEYPRDVMPLYAQGYSLAEFLIEQYGRREFIAYLSEGMSTNNWPAATSHHYGIADLGALQNTWLAWVAQGSPPLKSRIPSPETGPSATAIAAAGKLPRPEPNLIYHMTPKPPSADSATGSFPTSLTVSPASSLTVLPATAVQAPVPVAASDGWHGPGQPAVAATVTPASQPSPPAPVRTETAHPQGIESPIQTIIEWGQR
jgi:hypothetical protein